MNLTILTTKDRKALAENAIERVINQTLRCLDEGRWPNSSGCEPTTNEEDWKEAKAVVTFLWRSAQNALFVLANPDRLTVEQLADEMLANFGGMSQPLRELVIERANAILGHADGRR